MPIPIFINPCGAPSFASDDRIYLGEGLFETIRISQGKPRYPLLHWERLKNAAHSLAIPFDLTADEWMAGLTTSIQKGGIDHGGVKALLSAGSAKRGLAEQSTLPCLQFEAFTYQACSAPIRLITAPWLRDAHNPVYLFKSVNYLEAIIALRKAKTAGADDALFFNLQHHVTETTIANVFFIYKDTLSTPSLNCGILPGVIRQRLLAIAKKIGIPYSEQEISKDKLLAADAMFVCNALQGIRQVSALDGIPFNHSSLLLKLQKVLESDY